MYKKKAKKSIFPLQNHNLERQSSYYCAPITYYGYKETNTKVIGSVNSKNDEW